MLLVIESLHDMLLQAGQSRLTRRVLPLSGLLILSLIAVAWLALREPGLPDFSAYPAGAERKAVFFDFLAPLIREQNDRVLRDRERLRRIIDNFAAESRLSLIQRQRLKSLSRRYLLDPETPDTAALLDELERRVDMVPLPLVLVQAAKESGWGTSKFARDGNNLFGQWCYEAGCGLVPARRSAGARHEVRVFDSVADAIAGYLHNLNTGNAYGQLRQIRARLRRSGVVPDATSLADGLLYYSERRQDYVNEVKRMIDQYHRFQEQRG